MHVPRHPTLVRRMLQRRLRQLVPTGPLLAFSVTVRVERASQRGIVIGRGGEVLKAAGTAARRELEALLGVQVHLETRVKVDPDWQRRAHALDRLGL